ncbi:DUF1648 domain-containing protein [Streptococcus sp. SS6]|uniref:DUF1648 domain-containing protein n=1 Tax=Streptococcus salivarius TaxID=1304 RepID=A0A6G4NB27_STRSL|nr:MULTISPECIES: DUF1648 domain-containing protein [Streptococcus]MDN5036596.1 DUF1648 domain-containing protein [Streptococcus sp. SS6]NGG27775.1 DUF1648 domain-containing protein [Streptococcus salivarius]
MKNRLLKDILVLLVMMVIIVIICRFLPEKVPIHFNAKGVADMFANKYYLLLATVIPYSAYWKFVRGKENKKIK